MDAVELLRTWPGWVNAGAETVLASPAWRLSVRVGEESGLLRLDSVPLADTIDLDITLDGEPYVLSLADSSLYPDLHLLWGSRAGLPQEILLALVERECGNLFFMLENSTRRMFGVKGLAAAPSATARRMDVTLSAGTLSFALDLPPDIQALWGRLENLDTSHPEIRSLSRSARVDYCSLMLTDEERATMSPGDHLLVPDGFADTQKWIVDAPSDDALHLCSPTSREISFAEFADDSLPPIPDPDGLSLVLKEQTLHGGSLSRLGVARTVRIN